jgi:hypothetical protein
MLRCERCGTSFSETRGRKPASSPRCRVRDGVVVALTGADPESRPERQADSPASVAARRGNQKM